MKNITTLDVKFTALFKILFVMLIVWLVIQLKTLVIILFIAFIIATAVRPVVKTLEKYKFSKGLSVGIIYFLLIITIALLIYLIATPLANQLIELSKNLPTYLDSAQRDYPILNGFDLKDYFSNFTSGLNQSGKNLGGSLNTALTAASGVFDVFTSILTILILSLYLTLGLDKIVEGLLKFIPRVNHADVMRNYNRVEEQVGAWLRGQLLLMLVIGVFTYIVLKILGVPFSLPLAIFAGLMEILPIVGPLIYSVAIILVALTVSPIIAIFAAISCVIIQQLESNLIVPGIMKKAVGLSPVATILAILAGGTLLGIIGALLAVPVTAVLSALVQDLFAKE